MATDDDKERQITPPPWGADTSSGILKIVGPITAKKYKRREICRIYGGTRANVDLMVAAPDLLAACKTALHWLEVARSDAENEGGEDSQQAKSFAEPIKELVLAIRKAEGAGSGT